MLEDLVPPAKVWPCLVRKTLTDLEPKDRELLQQFLNDTDSWPAIQLSRALATKNIALSDKVIARHRLKGCSCSRILK